jgi:plastocyanin
MKTHTVTMTDQAFEPNPLTVRRGDTVLWVNADARPHSAKADDGKTFKTKELDQGKTEFTVIKHAPGRIPYTDGYGGHYKGVIIVI